MALVLSPSARGVTVPLATAIAVRPTVGVHVAWGAGGGVEFRKDGAAVPTTSACDAALHVARLAPAYHLDGAGLDDPQGAYLVEHTAIDVAVKTFVGGDFALVTAGLMRLNEWLKMRTYIVGYALTVADLAVADALRGSPIFKKIAQTAGIEDKYAHVMRWLGFIESHDCYKEAASTVASLVAAEKEAARKKAESGSFDIGLVGAEKGKVVTRFPPEPSGYLHIGHAKAVLLNEYFARTYEGKLIVRFDDTNPSKEKEEYEHAILEDIAMLKIKPDQITYTSDWFDKLLELAWKLLREGKAYADDTPKEEMRAQRMDGVESKNRNNSVEENARRFQEMIDGTEFGKTCCLRAKMSVDAKNKALRDPVMYRCNDVPHARTGTKFKVYPTYDFACPVVDSLEGVTHALRTDEYHDRNDQFMWFIDALNLRKVHIWDYSRVNFVYTLLSKRKLTWFVDNKRVTGWDDPRFPTIRGVLRRGMTVESLKEYILLQGASKNALNLEWDKFWALNRKALDPIAPRHTAVASAVPWTLVNGPDKPYSSELPKHKKNPDVGLKTTWFSRSVLIDSDDANELEVDEEVTLMDWGNAIARKIDRDASGKVVSVEGELHLEGDFKKTKKLTWLAKEGNLLPATLMDYDFLITKKKIEDEENFQDFLNEQTEFRTEVVVDNNLGKLEKGDFIQLERRGFYICDSPLASGSLVLITVPDGKLKAMSTLSGVTKTTDAKEGTAKDAQGKKGKDKDKPAKEGKGKDKAAAGKASPAAKVETAGAASAPAGALPLHLAHPILYTVRPVYDFSVAIDTQRALSGMYAMRPAYADLV